MYALVGLTVALCAATPVVAQDLPDKLTIHGYLTQAYAVSDSALSMGMPSEGTSDYRRMALLFRYDASMRDKFVIQLAHRRLGTSPIQAFESDVKLDWGFYEGRFGESTRLRVGRAPIPIGIYNETRYAGTVMPFYRAPFVNYNEGSWTAEAIDGVTLSHHFLSESPYSIEVTGYLGSYGYLESGTLFPPGAPPMYTVARARADRAAGAWAWLDTPLEGLRFGGGYKHARNSGGLYKAAGETGSDEQYYLSVDGSFDKFFVRAESRHDRHDGGGRFDGAFAQAGVRVTRNIWINAQAEAGKAFLPATPFTPEKMVDDLHRDYALGVNYAFAANLILKLEGHRTRSYNVDLPYTFFVAPPMKGGYLITSLSVSF
jgi:hypothetical protein